MVPDLYRDKDRNWGSEVAILSLILIYDYIVSPQARKIISRINGLLIIVSHWRDMIC